MAVVVLWRPISLEVVVGLVGLGVGAEAVATGDVLRVAGVGGGPGVRPDPEQCGHKSMRICFQIDKINAIYFPFFKKVQLLLQNNCVLRKSVRFRLCKFFLDFTTHTFVSERFV